jgi:methylmalonyl-CoA mutase cobalamin-binding subunit
MDRLALEQRLTQAWLEFGHQGFLRRVAAPMAQSLGDLWQQGVLAAAHEHFATVILRTFLDNCSRSFLPDEAAPCLVVATPPGNIHELGALLVAAAARNLGWRVVYLGASLPAGEIAGAARQNQARAVALSLVYPADDPNLGRELRELRRFLPPDTALLAGGRAATAYAAELRAVGACAVADLESLSSHLETLRHHRNGTPPTAQNPPSPESV